MKFLIVDDSNFVKQYLKNYISEAYPSADFELASSGEEAFIIYVDKKPDIIITDLLMPGTGGIEFVKKVRENDGDTKIVVLTADIQKTVREEVESLKINAFINKPATKNGILSAVSKLLC